MQPPGIRSLPAYCGSQPEPSWALPTLLQPCHALHQASHLPGSQMHTSLKTSPDLPQPSLATLAPCLMLKSALLMKLVPGISGTYTLPTLLLCRLYPESLYLFLIHLLQLPFSPVAISIFADEMLRLMEVTT